MEKEIKSTMEKRNFDELISKLPGGEILDTHEMLCVRGGDPDGGGGGTLIIPPPPPPPIP